MKKLLLIFLVFINIFGFSQNTNIYTDNFTVGSSVTGVASERDLGMATIGKAVTHTWFVSPNGDNTDGLTWETAFIEIQGALAVGSTDADDCNLILISPHATYYDINTTGDPTYSGNYILKGSHRLWAAIRNEHVSATSILKFTGKASLIDLAFFQTSAIDGVIFTKSGYRIRHCGFNSEATTGLNESIHIDGTAAFVRGGIIENVQIEGNVSYTTGLYMNNAKINTTSKTNIHNCINAIQIIHVDSDQNYFCEIGVGDCAIGLNLDAGNEQHFDHIDFHGNTTNIDDEVGGHIFESIHGHFSIGFEPDNFTGVTVATSAISNTWTVTDVELRSAASATKPFIIVGVSVEADATEKFRLRLTSDGGSTYFEDFQFEGDANAAKRVGANFPSGTGFIFNSGTSIEASSKSESGGNNVVVWLEIQEI